MSSKTNNFLDCLSKDHFKRENESFHIKKESESPFVEFNEKSVSNFMYRKWGIK